MPREDIERIVQSRAYVTKEVKEIAAYLLELADILDKKSKPKKIDVGKKVAKVIKGTIIKESK